MTDQEKKDIFNKVRALEQESWDAYVRSDTAYKDTLRLSTHIAIFLGELKEKWGFTDED